ncbi:hypothetical protein HK405_008064, partial [Cladochytrium tenue]
TTLTSVVRAAVNPALLEGGAVVLFQKDLPPNSNCVSMVLKPITFPTPVLISRSDVITGTADTPLPAAGADSHDLACTVTAAWHPSLCAILDSMSTADVVGGVTLIDNACHVMSPTAGSVANAALDDCARLADLVAGSRHSRHGTLLEQLPALLALRKSATSTCSLGLRRVRERAGKRVALSRMGGVKLYNQPPFEDSATHLDVNQWIIWREAQACVAILSEELEDVVLMPKWGPKLVPFKRNPDSDSEFARKLRFVSSASVTYRSFDEHSSILTLRCRRPSGSVALLIANWLEFSLGSGRRLRAAGTLKDESRRRLLSRYIPQGFT